MFIEGGGNIGQDILLEEFKLPANPHDSWTPKHIGRLGDKEIAHGNTSTHANSWHSF